MTDTNQLTWEKLRRFFEVDNFGMPLPAWYGELFDEFRDVELRKAKAEALKNAAVYFAGKHSDETTAARLHDLADHITEHLGGGDE